MKLEIYRLIVYDVITCNTIHRYNLIIDNHEISQIQITNQNSCDSIAVQELMNFFEDHINEMFDLSDKHIVNYDNYFSYMKPKKLCEFTYTECELKKLRINKKIEDINKDFED